MAAGFMWAVDFTVAGDTVPNRVAMWDGQAWQSIRQRDGWRSLCPGGGRPGASITAGGRFTSAGGIPGKWRRPLGWAEMEALRSGITIGLVVI